MQTSIDDHQINHQMPRLGVVEYHLLLKYFLQSMDLSFK
jgi:hypothetical protein